jgi:hypothetical protein
MKASGETTLAMDEAAKSGQVICTMVTGTQIENTERAYLFGQTKITT